LERVVFKKFEVGRGVLTASLPWSLRRGEDTAPYLS
jgi:hypothetical protein